MTRKEFDEILERTNAVVCNREWYERAIKALEQEPSEDCVSRQAVLNALDKRFDSIPVGQTTEILLLRNDLRKLPSVTLYKVESEDKE